MMEVQDLCKNFYSSDGINRVGLDKLSFSLDDGEWLNIVGPNGAGKSTLLKIIAGEISPDTGIISINGTNILPWPQSKKANFIQYIEADTLSNLVSSMTIEENLALSLDGFKFPTFNLTFRSSARNQIRELLASFDMDLENRLRTQIRFLSSGERQATVVAKTLLRLSMDVKILLLDEFTGALDPIMAPKFLGIVKRMAVSNRLSVLMVTHDLDLVERTSEKTVFLKHGKHYADLGSNISKDLYYEKG